MNRIGSIDCSGGVVVTGCYDGVVQCFDSSTLTLCSSFTAHAYPIRSIVTWTSLPTARLFVATASKDNTVGIWADDGTQICLCNGHMSSVESIAHSANENVLFSGDWNGNIFCWDTSTLSDCPEIEEEIPKKLKNSKGEAKKSISRQNAIEMQPHFTLRAHVQSVSGLQSNLQEGRLFSCSWDHSMKVWDSERHDCITTYVGSKICTSLHYSFESRLVVTSHSDGKIRLWDTRMQDETGCLETFGGSNFGSAYTSQVPNL